VWRWIRLAVVVAGTALSLVSLLGLIFDWGASAATETTQPAAESSDASLPSSSASAAPETETSAAFFAAFSTAIHDGDSSFLFDRLHPSVIARYGDAQCRSAAAGLADPTYTVTLTGVEGPATFDYASDGRTEPIPDTYTFSAAGTIVGQQSTRQYHFALVGGRYRSFLDCGDPV
jgi:hypothetical protein